MKIEVGKFYRDADGKVGGPAKVWSPVVEHPYELPGLFIAGKDSGDTRLFREDGSSLYGPSLVCEVSDPSAKPKAPASAGGGFFAGERIRLVSFPILGYRDIGEVLIAAPSACGIGVREECVSYTDRHGVVTWSPAVFWERSDSVEVVEGGYYLSKGGVVVGPMVAKNTPGTDGFYCSEKSLRQNYSPATSQWWRTNGKVIDMASGEEDHALVMRLDVPAKPVEVVEVKLSVDASEAIDHIKRVQAIADEAAVNLRSENAIANKKIANQEEQIGQLQSTVDEVTRSNSELHELINVANTNCDAYRDSFVIASSDYFSTKSKLEAAERDLTEAKYNLARIATLAEDQANAIHRLCDRVEWLHGKLFRTKQWCERFRKLSVINAEAASNWRIKASRPVIRAVPAKDKGVPLKGWIHLFILSAVVFATGVGCTLAVT